MRRVLCLTVLALSAVGADAQLQANFRLPRRVYVSGEPILLEYRVRNTSSRLYTIETTDPNRPCSGYAVKVQALSSQPVRACAARGFSCLGGFMTLRPGEVRRENYIVNLGHHMTSPGKYHISASRELHYSEASAGIAEPAVRLRMSSSEEFTVEVVESNQEALGRIIESYISELASDDFYRATTAWNIVTNFAPSSTETTALELSEHPDTLMAAIGMLGHMNTPAARERLAEIAGQPLPARNKDGSWPGNYSAAGTAAAMLGDSGDSKYYPLLLKLAETTPDGKGTGDLLTEQKTTFVLAAAKLGGDAARPFALAELSSSNETVRANAVFALAETGSRRAIPALIDLLLDPDEMIWINAAGRLQSLTHHRTVVEVSESGQRALWADWLHWWTTLGGASSRMYSPDECESPNGN